MPSEKMELFIKGCKYLIRDICNHYYPPDEDEDVTEDDDDCAECDINDITEILYDETSGYGDSIINYRTPWCLFRVDSDTLSAFVVAFKPPDDVIHVDMYPFNDRILIDTSDNLVRAKEYYTVNQNSYIDLIKEDTIEVFKEVNYV